MRGPAFDRRQSPVCSPLCMQSAHPNQARLCAARRYLASCDAKQVTLAVFKNLVAAFLAPPENVHADATEPQLVAFKVEDSLRCLARSRRIEQLSRERVDHAESARSRAAARSGDKPGNMQGEVEEMTRLLQAVKSMQRPPVAMRRAERDGLRVCVAALPV